MREGKMNEKREEKEGRKRRAKRGEREVVNGCETKNIISCLGQSDFLQSADSKIYCCTISKVLVC